MSDDHIRVLEEGGIIEESVLMIPHTEEAAENFAISDCRVCESAVGEVAYIWGKKIGDSKMVALQVYCGEDCVTHDIAAFGNEVRKDIIICYVAH